MWRRLIGLSSAAAMLLAPSADAMQYRAFRLDSNKMLLTASGGIEANEGAAFLLFLKGLPRDLPIVGLALSSGGGNVLGAEQMAAVIHGGRVNVAVLGGAVCASACFLLFAASPHKFAAPDARIGVHSTSNGTGESLATFAVTTAVARDASGYGVPPEILGRMVTTPPGAMAWLTHAELSAMGVTFLTAHPQSSTAFPSPAAPATVAPTDSPLFGRGLADRTAWEAWLARLSGAFRAGADYWAEQRSLPQPGSCRVMAIRSPDPDGFAAGCSDARRLLARSDRLRQDPDYSAGWNSF